MDDDDSVEQHLADTIDAGAGLCDESAVLHTVSHGKEMITWLLQLGVEFTYETGLDGKKYLHLTREGGHTHRRVVHAADATGWAIQNALIKNTQKKSNIELFDHHIAIDLITTHKHLAKKNTNQCVGAYVLDTEENKVKTFKAKHVILGNRWR